MKFIFDNVDLKEFEILKNKLTLAPIIISLNWSKSFEVMCDTCSVAFKVGLGQK